MEWSKVLSGLTDGAKLWASALTIVQLSQMIEAFYDIDTSKPEHKIEQYAANIGKQGEQSFEDTVKTLPANYTVINTAKAGHVGDFVIEYSVNGRLYRCLVDIKTYRSTVPKKEIDKFISDMTYGNYDGGLLLSSKSNFVGYPQSIHIQTITLPYGRVPIMFIAKMSTNLINSCIEVICTKMSALVQVQMEQSSVMSSVNFINTSLSHSATTRRLLSELQINTSTQIQKCQENLISGEVQIKMALKQMKFDINKMQIVLLDVPEHQARSNNIIDKASDASPDLAIKEFEVEAEAEVEVEAEDFLYHGFCINDIALIQQLTDMPWTSIAQDRDRSESTFESQFVNIDITPLKTKTRIEIFDADNISMNVPKSISSLLVRKSKKYIGSLSQDMVNVLNVEFSKE